MSCHRKLTVGAKKLGIELTEAQAAQFIDYQKLLQKWNQTINLTTIDESEEIIIKHFLDSLSLLAKVELEETEKIIDIGTGAGFPGLPLKLVYPELELTLLEAVKKKVTFLRHVIYSLNLTGIEVIHGRAEDYGRRKKYREQYDYGLARAVAELNILTEYSLPFICPGGQFIAYKGEEGTEELKDSKRAVKLLGGEKPLVKEISLPFSSAKRNLVIVNKINSTPSNYPRSSGTPAKNPL